MNNFVTENTIYGIGLAILFTIFFQVIAKLIFDDPTCVENQWRYLLNDNKNDKCKAINDRSTRNKVIFLMFIIIIAMISYHYIDNYRSIQMGLGIGSIFLLLTTLCVEWRNNSNKMNALLSGFGIIVLSIFSIKKT